MFGDYNLNVFSMKEGIHGTREPNPPLSPHIVHIWVASFISLCTLESLSRVCTSTAAFIIPQLPLSLVSVWT